MHVVKWWVILPSLSLLAGVLSPPKGDRSFKFVLLRTSHVRWVHAGLLNPVI